jgi:hypothetical protein
MTTTSYDSRNAHTDVSIVLQGGSGSIYCVQGANLPIKAFWKNNNTIVIETSKEYTPMIQYHIVRSFEDVVKIEYVK